MTDFTKPVRFKSKDLAGYRVRVHAVYALRVAVSYTRPNGTTHETWVDANELENIGPLDGALAEARELIADLCSHDRRWVTLNKTLDLCEARIKELEAQQ